jgi:hypothetical protein
VLRTRLEQRGFPIDRLIGASLVATAIGMSRWRSLPTPSLLWEVIYVECLASIQSLMPSLSGVLTVVFFTLTAAATGAYGVCRPARPSPRAVPV